jgi:hypothetical protein
MESAAINYVIRFYYDPRPAVNTRLLVLLLLHQLGARVSNLLVRIQQHRDLTSG